MRGGPSGDIEVTVPEDGLLVCRAYGLLTRDVMERGARAVQAAVAQQSGAVYVLRDALEVEGVEPGSAFIVIRSAREYAARTAASVLVTQNRAIASLGAVFEKLVPNLPHRVCATREAGLEFLRFQRALRAAAATPPNTPR